MTAGSKLAVPTIDTRPLTRSPGAGEVMREALLARGGDPVGADSTVAHMRERDYPISAAEFRGIFEDVGFSANTRHYDAPGEPMAPYVAFCTAAISVPSPGLGK